MYVADLANGRIRKISVDGTINTVAGNGSAGSASDGGPPTRASLHGPSSVTIDAAGNMYLADSQNNRVRKVAVDGTITTIAGGGNRSGASSNGGPATNALLNDPLGVAVDATKNLYIADVYNNLIHKSMETELSPQRQGPVLGVIRVMQGRLPGLKSANRKASPWMAGNFFFADTGNNVVRKVDASGRISTLAGNGIAGYSGDGGPATGARLHEPTAVAVDAVGNVYIADSCNFVVRKVR